jgi:hypothetical protein
MLEEFLGMAGLVADTAGCSRGHVFDGSGRGDDNRSGLRDNRFDAMRDGAGGRIGIERYRTVDVDADTQFHRATSAQRDHAMAIADVRAAPGALTTRRDAGAIGLLDTAAADRALLRNTGWFRSRRRQTHLHRWCWHAW